MSEPRRLADATPQTARTWNVIIWRVIQLIYLFIAGDVLHPSLECFSREVSEQTFNIIILIASECNNKMKAL